MRPSPCFGAASLLCALSLALAAGPAAARICLPPLFEGGQRLHPLGDIRVMWLDPLLRQHEICWRERDDETRIALFGNSAVFGFPLPVEQSFGALVNERFAADGVHAHLFNLAWVFTYQVRDALILHQALAYDPDVIVFALTLADMMHVAPVYFPTPLVRFFELNTDALSALDESPPPGFAEPFHRYRPVAERAPWLVAAERVRQLGYIAHALAQEHADRLARRLGATPPAARSPLSARKPARYNCDETLRNNADMFQDFAEWTPLDYLAEIQTRTGRTVLVVNWPIAPEPQGECYNRRYGRTLLDRYNHWLAAATAAHGLAYLDLHDLLAAGEFIDSLHVNPAGHQRIAARVADRLEDLVHARGSRLDGSRSAEARP